MKSTFIFPAFVFIFIFIACGDSEKKHDGQSDPGMVMQANEKLMDFRGPTNWEYGGTQPRYSSIFSYYAKNIAIDFRHREAIVNPPKAFMLLAVKDTANGLYLVAREDFLNRFSGNNIKMIFDSEEEQVFGFSTEKVNYLDDTMTALSIQKPSFIFDRFNRTNHLVLKAQLADIGPVELVFITKGFFWTR